MKRSALILIGITFALTLHGCAGKGAEPIAAAELQTAAGEDIIVNDQMMTEASGAASEPLQTETEEAETEAVSLPPGLENMLAPMDGLLMCTAENGYPYDAEDDLFFWSAIFYTAGNYPAFFADTQMTPDGLVVPAETLQYYAAALFDHAREISEVAIPEQLAGIVSYDAQNDSYLFATGDRGLSYASIESVQEQENGLAADVVAGLYDAETNERFAAAEFELLLKRDAASGKDTVFGYSIARMKILPQD